MADDVTFQSATLATPPAGTKVSADEDSSNALIQRVKLAYSADGARTHVPADDDGLLVNLGANNDVTVTGTVGVSGTVPVSAVSLPLPSGAATSGKQDTEIASLASLDSKAPALGQALAAASVPVVLTAAQLSTLTPPAAITGFLTESDFDTKTGGLTETAPATDTASSGLNGRLQRIAQRLTSLIAALGSPFQAGGSIGNTTFASTVADGADVTIGAKADAKSTATDSTAITAMSVWKQISASVQAIASAIAGTLTVSLPSGASTLAEQQTQTTSLQLIDDVVYTDDTSTHATGTSKGALMMAAATPTDGSVNANDIGAVAMTTDRKLHVSVQDALPAGTAAIGKLAANSGVDIGDVDVTSVPTDPFGANADAQSASGSISAKLRFIATTGIPVTGTVTVGSHAVTNAGTFATQVDGAALTALQLIDDPVVQDDNAFTPGTTKVSMAGFQADETSTDSVDEGDGGAARMTLDRKVIVTPQPHTAGGLSIFRSLDIDETEEDVKTSAGQVYGVWITNTATSTRFVKFYNATAANTTVGSTTPVITIGIPGNSSDDISAMFSSTHGIAFDTAICVAATTGAADNDTGAPSTGDVIINVFYK